MSKQRQQQLFHIGIVAALLLVGAWAVPIIAQSFAPLFGSELRVIDATNPRIAFMESEGADENVYIDYVVSTDTLEFYTGFANSSVLFKAVTSGSVTNDVLELSSGQITMHQVTAFNSTFNGIGGTHTGASISRVASSSDALEVENSSDSNATAWKVIGDGTHTWGDSGGINDTNLYRNAADELKTDDSLTVAVDLDVDGELEGSRSIVSFGTNSNITADRYISWGTATSSAQGFVTARAGSIVELSGNCDVLIGVGGTTFDIEAQIDAVNALEIAGLDSASTGVKTGSTTQARGSDTFTADQVLNCRIDINTGGQTVDNCQCHIGVVYDS